jgi:hypothetical protein
MTTAYVHAIETSTDGEVWQAVRVSDAPEEYDGTSGEYAADVLAQWLTDECPGGAPVDGDGNPLIRCRAYPAGSDLVVGEAYPSSTPATH